MAERKSNPKNLLPDNPEGRAGALSLLFIVVGLGVLWLAKEVLDLGGDAVLVSLLLLPALLYLALSGRLTEITGPGGVGAKFREVGAKPAPANWQKLTEEEVQMVTKGGLDELRRLRPTLGLDDRPIVLTFTLGAGHSYHEYMVRSYVEVLAALRRFLAVVFLDPDGRLLAYMSAIRFVALMRSQQADSRFMRDLSDPDALQHLVTTPGVSTETLPAGSTNSDALQLMTRRGLEVLALVDDAGQFKGVVERERVISDILLAVMP
jgi:CBS domain-containing protein